MTLGVFTAATLATSIAAIRAVGGFDAVLDHCHQVRVLVGVEALAREDRRDARALALRTSAS